MATAPELQVDPADQVQDNEPVDFEAEAKRMGWVSAEDFQGDPSRHVDAETFYNNALEKLPLANAAIKKLTARLANAEKQISKASEFFSKAEQRAYERALAEIRAEQEAAVEVGDLAAHRAASDRLDKLEKPIAAKTSEVDAEQRAEDFAEWGKANKWYATNAVMAAYADTQAELISKRKSGFLDREDLDAVAEKVKAKFADEFPEDFDVKSRPRPRNPVEGVSQARSRSGGYTFSDLPPEAKATCDKWVKTGLIKSREEYVKSFDFKGWSA